MSKPVTGLYRALFGVFRPIFGTWFKYDVKGLENLPREGGFIVTPNHISNVDPPAVAFFMLSNGYPARFMAKAELFKVPVLGSIGRAINFVPVDRKSSDAGGALAPAIEALKAGECVVVYPEGTLTRDPQYWPMRAKTGAARLALDTGVPVIPLAQWGANEIMSRYSSVMDVRPKRPVSLRFLPAVDLSDLMSEQGSQDRDAVNEATIRIYRAITSGVEELRGEEAPAQPWDPDKMSGPDKKTLGRFGKWRKQLARKGSAKKAA